MSVKDLGRFVYTNDEDSFLGKGSFASVFRGYFKHEHPHPKAGEADLSRVVAVKVISRLGMSDELENHLKQEINAMRVVESPYVVRLYDVQSTKRKHYIIMEYCGGGDLQKYLEKLMKKKLKIPLGVVRKLIYEIGQGMGEIAKLELMHRDLKPANIFLSSKDPKNMVAKVADLGFAKTLNRKSQLNKTFCGSPMYMAPELLNEERYTRSIDLWSLGVIFYQLSTMKVPFSALNIYILKEKLNGEVVKYPKKLDPYIKDLVSKLLIKDPKHRMTYDQLAAHPTMSNSYLDTEMRNRVKFSMFLAAKNYLGKMENRKKGTHHNKHEYGVLATQIKFFKGKGKGKGKKNVVGFSIFLLGSCGGGEMMEKKMKKVMVDENYFFTLSDQKNHDGLYFTQTILNRGFLKSNFFPFTNYTSIEPFVTNTILIRTSEKPEFQILKKLRTKSKQLMCLLEFIVFSIYKSRAQKNMKKDEINNNNNNNNKFPIKEEIEVTSVTIFTLSILNQLIESINFLQQKIMKNKTDSQDLGEGKKCLSVIKELQFFKSFMMNLYDEIHSFLDTKYFPRIIKTEMDEDEDVELVEFLLFKYIEKLCKNLLTHEKRLMIENKNNDDNNNNKRKKKKDEGYGTLLRIKYILELIIEDPNNLLSLKARENLLYLRRIEDLEYNIKVNIIEEEEEEENVEDVFDSVDSDCLSSSFGIDDDSVNSSFGLLDEEVEKKEKEESLLDLFKLCVFHEKIQRLIDSWN